MNLEYCHLFLGPGAPRCPPYGSVYLNSGQTWGPSTADVLRRYRRLGLAPVKAWRQPPDHIALELAFMARLSIASMLASDGGRGEGALASLEVQQAFLHDHLGRWAPILARRLCSVAPSPMYRFLGEFLPSWLSFDAEFLRAAIAVAKRVGGRWQ